MAAEGFRNARIGGRLRRVETLRFIALQDAQHFTDGSFAPAHCRELAKDRPFHVEER